MLARAALVLGALGALALLPSCSNGLDLLRDARRIEVSVVGVASSTVAIEDPAEVALICSAARKARPTLLPVAWKWRHVAAFTLGDGRVVRLGFAPNVPDLIGVKLPGARSSEDHDYPATLRALIEPSIEQADALAGGAR